MERVFVVGSKRMPLYDKWNGSNKGYAEFEASMDKARDRILSQLDLSKINSREDYYQQIALLHYSDKKQQNAFFNWGIMNYGNQREIFFDKWIYPLLLRRAQAGEVKLKSGVIRRGIGLDARSYLAPIQFRSRSGKLVEYLQRRDYKTGRILSVRGILKQTGW